MKRGQPSNPASSPQPGQRQKRSAPASSEPHPPVTPQSRRHVTRPAASPETGAAQRPLASQEELVMMVLDIVEEGSGRFHVWGTSQEGRSVLVRVTDFQPYFYMAAPEHQAVQGSRSAGAHELSGDALHRLQQFLNRQAPPDSTIQAVEQVERVPIMFYRPGEPGGTTFLKLMLCPGGNAKKTAAHVANVAKKGQLRAQGFNWRDTTQYEHEVNPLQRFLVDASISGGAWLHIAPHDPAQGTPDSGFQPVPGTNRCSSCDIEEGLDLAKDGHIAPLKLMTVDVVMAPKDGKDRVPVAATDPIIAITCILHSSHEATAEAAAAPATDLTVEGAMLDDELADGMGDGEVEDMNDVSAAAAAASGSQSISGDKVVFSWASDRQQQTLVERGSGATVRCFESEEAMLLAWLEHFRSADPDAIPLFQVKGTLGAIAERFSALGLAGGALHISRSSGGHSKALSVKRVVQYSPNWVKSQNRMASTSNQETWRAELEGRQVFDLLRQVLTSCNLASFSLVDCVQSLLGARLEVLPSSVLAQLARLVPPQGRLLLPASLSRAERAASHTLRLARYSMARAQAVVKLLWRLATVPETIELARATGLTLGQVLYNAQMIRTWSLLLRNARRQGYIVSGRQDAYPLSESPYLIHPVETGAVGLYKTPVAILDFASLYPSLYRAYNLCYTTLLHPDDAAKFGPDNVTVTPTGAVFVKSEVRKGILPTILGALITARAATRQTLKNTENAYMRAVLDSRQKALKLTANALYGFTGAQASPLQCVPLADSCLAMGAQSCRKAREVLEASAAAGALGPHAAGAKVIYGQTDSLFAHFPQASAGQAIQAGQAAAKVVSAAFPPEMEIKFERVCQPFMLLHVNRYAGRAYEKEEDLAGPGSLMVKGLKSMWRQAAPVVRNVLQGSLRRIIMQDDVKGAVEFVEGEVRRLLSGRCELWEMVMTGGLWRVTGQQVERAAAVQEGSATPTAGADDAEVRGPHAALAVRLQQRDAGRTFGLGERLQYVLLPGMRTQDEAAEDPLAAAKAQRSADVDLYWTNKMQKPLSELFATCLSPSALQALLSGSHTLVRVDHASLGLSSPGQSPAPARGGKRQTGLMQFYKGTLKCLGCKRTIPWKPPPGDPNAVGPGLCESCSQEEGKLAAVYLDLQQQENHYAMRFGLAMSSCIQCHSGGLTGPVLCENGECPVLHARLESQARQRAVQRNLQRLDW
ncbi:hypothetical protein WJX72_009511 [[Myrmecia] bisecta]|uniref:DNA polymerase delta catalytic subunit n=1 Tax=[Myrmecia] bisecta TaxID=41462 RepID=A0AAW1PPN1_9CHLO